jgi:hypothetical protein
MGSAAHYQNGRTCFPIARKLWRELKLGVPLNEVLGGALDRGRGDWPVLRAQLRRLCL